MFTTLYLKNHISNENEGCTFWKSMLDSINAYLNVAILWLLTGAIEAKQKIPPALLHCLPLHENGMEFMRWYSYWLVYSSICKLYLTSWFWGLLFNRFGRDLATGEVTSSLGSDEVRVQRRSDDLILTWSRSQVVSILGQVEWATMERKWEKWFLIDESLLREWSVFRYFHSVQSYRLINLTHSNRTHMLRGLPYITGHVVKIRIKKLGNNGFNALRW